MQLTLSNFWVSSALAILTTAAPAFAQKVLTVIPPEAVNLKAGQPGEAKLHLKLKSGYHVYSNKSADPFLIPLKLVWAPGAAESATVEFPEPEPFKSGDKMYSVFSGEFDLTIKLKVAARGMSTLSGKLTYQACTDRMCDPPKTIEVHLPLNVQ